MIRGGWSMTDLQPLTLIDSRFTNVVRVGRGGFADVFAAQDNILRRTIAIKRYFRPASELGSIRDALSACAILSHPHIAQLLDLYEQKGQLFLVINYCAGGSLAEKLESGQLSRQEAM